MNRNFVAAGARKLVTSCEAEIEELVKARESEIARIREFVGKATAELRSAKEAEEDRLTQHMQSLRTNFERAMAALETQVRELVETSTCAMEAEMERQREHSRELLEERAHALVAALAGARSVAPTRRAVANTEMPRASAPPQAATPLSQRSLPQPPPPYERPQRNLLLSSSKTPLTSLATPKPTVETARALRASADVPRERRSVRRERERESAVDSCVEQRDGRIACRARHACVSRLTRAYAAPCREQDVAGVLHKGHANALRRRTSAPSRDVWHALRACRGDTLNVVGHFTAEASLEKETSGTCRSSEEVVGATREGTAKALTRPERGWRT